MRILILTEEEMQQQTRSTLDVIYENWRGYHAKLRDCIAPLTNEQLLFQPAARMWPLGQIVQHIIAAEHHVQLTAGSCRCCSLVGRERLSDGQGVPASGS